MERCQGDRTFVSTPTELPFPDEEDEDNDLTSDMPHQLVDDTGLGSKRRWMEIGAGRAHTVLRTAAGHVYVWGEFFTDPGSIHH